VIPHPKISDVAEGTLRGSSAQVLIYLFVYIPFTYAAFHRLLSLPDGNRPHFDERDIQFLVKCPTLSLDALVLPNSYHFLALRHRRVLVRITVLVLWSPIFIQCVQDVSGFDQHIQLRAERNRVEKCPECKPSVRNRPILIRGMIAMLQISPQIVAASRVQIGELPRGIVELHQLEASGSIVNERSS
jgi:hypothetical protein